MEKKDINRLKVVLVEKKRTGRWLAEQLEKILPPCLNGVQTLLSQVLKLY
ncbi:toxin-antitoxin system, antitoxin component, Xre domain protein [Prevotella bivia]|uniref:Toxin-antitoxin system, antitoxin component, Xre domain protein n=1 Tax=Prevotella bivia TaxID=28125 RepID=A0A137SRY4_9BACT|nr:toxin-antitoxin system, antitoxin component, Xre domain protein [Prevotella bivia]